MLSAQVESANDTTVDGSVDTVANSAVNPNETNSKRFAESRRSARAIALQALYEWDAVKHSPADSVGRIADDFIEDAVRKPILAYAAALVADVQQDEARLDGLIQAHATAYPVSQLATVDRNALRLALSEITRERVSPAIAIDEAVELARTYGTESSARFVHGVLGGVLAELSIAP